MKQKDQTNKQTNKQTSETKRFKQAEINKKETKN